MPNSFENLNTWNQAQAEKNSAQDPVVKIDSKGSELRFSEWRTHAQLTLEHNFILLSHLIHDRSLSYSEHKDHPFYELDTRIRKLLKSVSLQGDIYRFPYFGRVILGDEQSPTAPITEKEQQEYEVVLASVNRFEAELEKFRAVGVGFPSAEPQRPAQTGIPAVPFAQPQQAAVTSPEARNSQMANDRVINSLQQSLAEQGTSVAEAPREVIRIGLNPLENPADYVRGAVQLYTEQNMPEWAAAISSAEAAIRNMSAEIRAHIERELSEGAIAILMPGKEVQKNTLAKAIDNLKPVWYVNGQQQQINPTYHEWDHINNLVAQKHESLFIDVPDSPYISLTKPTQTPPANTLNKTLSQQQTEFRRLRQENQNIHAMNIPGFISTQSWATRAEFTAAGGRPNNITPLDRNTFTRFIDLPVSEGCVPCGDFNAFDRRVGLGRNIAGSANSNSGFRLEVRIPL